MHFFLLQEFASSGGDERDPFERGREGRGVAEEGPLRLGELRPAPEAGGREDPSRVLRRGGTRDARLITLIFFVSFFAFFVNDRSCTGLILLLMSW